MTAPRAASGVALTDVIRLAMGASLASTHVAFPARVEAYDSEAQTVDVRPQLERATKAIDGTLVREALPIVCSVPICWPRSGAFGITFPLELGDFVLVVVCDRNLGEWRRTGEAGDPRDAGVHVLDGAVAIPGLYPSAGALDAEHVTDHLVLGALTTDGATIHLRPDGIRIGSDAAAQKSVRGDDQKDALSTFVAAVETWAGLVKTGVEAAGGGTLVNTALSAAIAQLKTDLAAALSTKVTVE